MTNTSPRRVVLMLAVLVAGSTAFYFPGVGVKSFKRDEPVDLFVNKLTSVKTQLPLEYYKILPWCKPAKVGRQHENLGQILRGDVIEHSSYEVPPQPGPGPACWLVFLSLTLLSLSSSS